MKDKQSLPFNGSSLYALNVELKGLVVVIGVGGSHVIRSDGKVENCVGACNYQHQGKNAASIFVGNR